MDTQSIDELAAMFSRPTIDENDISNINEELTPDEAYAQKKMLAQENSPIQELGQGIDIGVDQTAGMLFSGAETVASAAGFTDMAKRFRDYADYRNGLNEGRVQAVDDYKDVHDFTSGMQYAAGIIGTQAPQFVPDAVAAVASGGMSAIGTMAFRRGVTAALAREAFASSAMKGVAASQYLRNTGESRDIQLQQGIDDPTYAMNTGAAKTALDYMSMKGLLSSAGRLAQQGLGAEAKHILAEGLKDTVMEGSTEGIQTLVDHVAVAGKKQGYDPFSDDAIHDIVNSAFAGALMGGTPAVISGTGRAIKEGAGLAFGGKETTQNGGKQQTKTGENTQPFAGQSAPNNTPETAAAPEAGSVQEVPQEQPVYEQKPAPVLPTDAVVEGADGVEQAPAPAPAPAPAQEQPTESTLPRVQLGGADWVNSNAQLDRDRADRNGITANIESLFADGLTAKQVNTKLSQAGALDWIPLEDRAAFITNVRATLGIPSQATEDGKADFAVWLAARAAREAKTDSKAQAQEPSFLQATQDPFTSSAESMIAEPAPAPEAAQNTAAGASTVSAEWQAAAPREMNGSDDSILARNEIPDSRLHTIGDNFESPWLMADGTVVGSNGDHISLSDELGFGGYRDMSLKTGAVRSTFHLPRKQTEDDKPFVSIQLFDDQKLTKKQYDKIASFVNKTGASILVGVDTTGANISNVDKEEVSLEGLKKLASSGEPAAYTTQAQDAEAESAAFMAAESEPAPRFQAGRAALDPAEFLTTPTVASSENAAVDAARNEAADANELQQEYVNSRMRERYGNVRVVEAQDMDVAPEERAVLDAISRGMYKAERSITRRHIMQSNTAEDLAQRTQSDVDAERFADIKKAARRDQNSFYSTNDKDFFWFRDTQQEDNVFPVYMPDAVASLVNSQHSPVATSSANARDKAISAYAEVMATMREHGYEPVDESKDTPITYTGKTAMRFGDFHNTASMADLESKRMVSAFSGVSSHDTATDGKNSDQIASANSLIGQESRYARLRDLLENMRKNGINTVAGALDELDLMEKQRLVSPTLVEHAGKIADSVINAHRDSVKEFAAASIQKFIRMNDDAAVARDIYAATNAVTSVEKLSTFLRAKLADARIKAAELSMTRAVSAYDNSIKSNRELAKQVALLDLIDVLNEKLYAVRAEDPFSMREAYAENKYDAIRDPDPYERTFDPFSTQTTDEVFAANRTDAGDKKAAMTDAAQRAYERGQRGVHKGTLASEVEATKATVEQVLAQEKNRVIMVNHDTLSSLGVGLAQRLDSLARSVGLQAKTVRVMFGNTQAAATVTEADGVYTITVGRAAFNAMSPEAREAVLAHELGHVVAREILSKADARVLARLAEDFKAARDKVDAAHAYRANGEAVGFDEYLADQFAAYARARESGVKPAPTGKRKTGRNTLFEDILSKLKTLLSRISEFVFGDDRLAGTRVGFEFMQSMVKAASNSKRGVPASAEFFENWMQQVYDGHSVAKRSRAATAVAAGLRNDDNGAASDFALRDAKRMAGGVVQSTLSVIKHPVQAGKQLARAMDRLHRDIPILITAREELRGISRRIADGYDRIFDKSQADNDAWQQRINRMFAEVDKQQLADYIAGSAELPAPIKNYLTSLYEHLKKDLPTLGNIKDFFPRMYNMDALRENRDAFIKLVIDEAANNGAQINVEQATHIWSNIVNGRSLYTSDVVPEVTVHGSTFQSSKQRMIPFVSDAALRRGGFLQNDIEGVLRHYTHKGIRMKHFASEFAQYSKVNYGDAQAQLAAAFPGISFDFDMESATQAQHDVTNRKILEFMFERAPLVDPNTGTPLGPQAKRKALANPTSADDYMRMNAWAIKQLVDSKWIQVSRGKHDAVELAFFDMNAGLRGAMEVVSTPEQRRVAKIIDAYEGRLAADSISPRARNVMSGIMAYENLTTMLFSTFTSLADAAGLVFRGRDMQGALANMAEMGRILKDLKRSGRLETFKALGYAERQVAMQSFLEAYGIQHESPMAHKINHALFTLNGQIGLTNIVRVMAAALGESHLGRAVADLEGGDKFRADMAQKMLDDLGVSVDDVKAMQSAGFKHYNEHVDAGTADTKDGEQALRIHTAITRYVNESITRPDARARPVWGSDPRFALIYQFKSFIFAYWEKIMKPVLRDSIERFNTRQGSQLDKTIAAAAPLMVFVIPTMAMSAAGLWLRQLLQYEVWGDEAPAASMELPAYTYEVMKRGGILGPFEMGFTFVENNAQGRSGVAQLLGPTVSHLEVLLQGDLNRSAARSTPVFSQIPALRDWAKGMFE